MNPPTSTPQAHPVLPQLLFKGLAQLQRGPSTAAQGAAQGGTSTCAAPRKMTYGENSGKNGGKYEKSWNNYGTNMEHDSKLWKHDGT